MNEHYYTYTSTSTTTAGDRWSGQWVSIPVPVAANEYAVVVNDNGLIEDGDEDEIYLDRLGIE